MKKQTTPSVRLVKHVTPLRYEITLKPDLEAHVFGGFETVTLMLDKAVTELTLHSKNLEIMNVSVRIGKKVLSADAISYNEAAETATFHFAERLPAGKIFLELSFSGILNDTMRGFYRSRYVVDGKERFMATTQFESTDARQAFPCVDEPAAKAVFDVHLIVPNDRTAISNTMPVATREHSAGYSIVSFSPTPKMSTYLLAFIVGDFEYIEARTKRDVLVRVFTVPGRKEQGRFSLDCAVRTLDFYEEYFAIKYPMPVLDMIAIPDFAAGAMENWGAVTYRDAILIDEETTAIPNRQWVAIVVAHELAHQWFGNLVTMDWWTDLWLNEGFASYIEYLAADHLFPEWNIWSQFLLQDHGPALRLDSLATTHPIEVKVHHPDEIAEIFDEVSYSKGAAVIRMLAEYLGPKHFRDGLRHYLKKHSYKNTNTVDLWDSFEHVSKQPVRKIMQNWTRMSGYPVISAAYDGKNLTLGQERFFMSPLSAKKSTDTTTWMVPVSVQSSKGVSKNLLTKKTTKVPATEGWVKLNVGESGLFRVSYEAELLGRLCAPIADKTLAASDRHGIIRDLFALAEAGKHSATVPLDMLAFYASETEYVVWGDILSGVGKIAHVFSGTPFEKQLHAQILKYIGPKAFEIGWEKKPGEAHEMGLLRSAMLYAAGHYGDRAVVKEAQARFAMREKTPIVADLRSVVYRLVAENGGEAEYNAFLAMYHAATVSEEKNRVGMALGYFKQTKLLKKTLALALSKDVRPQDAPRMISWVAGSTHGGALAWEFMQKNWKELHRRYSSGGHMLPHLIAPLSAFTDKQYAKEIVSFFKKNTAPGAARTITQIEEKILLSDAWKKRDMKKLAAWVRDAQ